MEEEAYRYVKLSLTDYGPTACPWFSKKEDRVKKTVSEGNNDKKNSKFDKNCNITVQKLNLEHENSEENKTFQTQITQH